MWYRWNTTDQWLEQVPQLVTPQAENLTHNQQHAPYQLQLGNVTVQHQQFRSLTLSCCLSAVCLQCSLKTER